MFALQCRRANSKLDGFHNLPQKHLQSTEAPPHHQNTSKLFQKNVNRVLRHTFFDFITPVWNLVDAVVVIEGCVLTTKTAYSDAARRARGHSVCPPAPPVLQEEFRRSVSFNKQRDMPQATLFVVPYSSRSLWGSLRGPMLTKNKSSYHQQIGKRHENEITPKPQLLIQAVFSSLHSLHSLPSLHSRYGLWQTHVLGRIWYTNPPILTPPRGRGGRKARQL